MSEVETPVIEGNENKRSEPEVKRAVVFMQADVLFQEAKRYFGTTRLDFEPDVLAKAIVERNADKGWVYENLYVYVSQQDIETNEKWHRIWNRAIWTWAKKFHLNVFSSIWSTKYLNVMNRKGVEGLRDIYSSPVFVNDMSRNKMICDIISKAHYGEFDVAVIITKDDCMVPVAYEIRDISYKTHRWLKVVNAFPFEEQEGKRSGCRGIDMTDWFHIDYDMWEDCQGEFSQSTHDKEEAKETESTEAE